MDLLAAAGMAVGTATLGLMGAFALVFVPAWLAFRLAPGWRWTLLIAAGPAIGCAHQDPTQVQETSQASSHTPLAAPALAWGGASLLVLREYRRIGGQAAALNDLWFLLSLLWLQFAFAAMYADWRRTRGRNFRSLLIRAVLPPLLLHVIVFNLP
jgi:hypothetical protein